MRCISFFFDLSHTIESITITITNTITNIILLFILLFVSVVLIFILVSIFYFPIRTILLWTFFDSVSTIYKKGSVWFDAVDENISCVFPLQTTRTKQAIRRIELETDCTHCDRNGVSVCAGRRVKTCANARYLFSPRLTGSCRSIFLLLLLVPVRRLPLSLLLRRKEFEYVCCPIRLKNTTRHTILSLGLCCHNTMIFQLH